MGNSWGRLGELPGVGELCRVHPTSISPVFPPVSPPAAQPVGHSLTPPVDTTKCPQPWEPPVSPPAHPKEPVTAVPRGSATQGSVTRPCQLQGCHRARASKRRGVFAQEGRGWQAGSARGCRRHVGHGDATLGMPALGYGGACEAQGGPGMGRKFWFLGAELGGAAGTRFIPGKNPPHPTEQPGLTPPQTPPIQPGPEARMGKLRHGGGGDGKVQQHQSAGGKTGKKI